MARALRWLSALILSAYPVAVLAMETRLEAMVARYGALYDRGVYGEAAAVAEEALALARLEVAANDPRLASLLRDLAELDRVRQDYRAAEWRLLEAVGVLEEALGPDHPEVMALRWDLAEVVVLLGDHDRAEELRRRGLAPDVLVLRGAFDAGRPGAGTLAQRVIGNVYDFFDRESVEVPGYGRYTYVLFPTHGPRNARLLEALLASTPGADLGLERAHLNVFYVPVRAAHRNDAYRMLAGAGFEAAALAGPLAGAYYDHALAAEVLARLCSFGETPRICATALSEGPYLVTLPGPLSLLEAEPGAYLIVDLSAIHPAAFPKFIDAVKVQIRQPDFTDLDRIDRTRLALLSMILNAADILTVVRPALAEIVQMVGSTGTVE